MKYYIIEPKTERWVEMNFTHVTDLRLFQQLYPTLKFVAKDQTLHGKKMYLDPSKKFKSILGVKSGSDYR